MVRRGLLILSTGLFFFLLNTAYASARHFLKEDNADVPSKMPFKDKTKLTKSSTAVLVGI